MLDTKLGRVAVYSSGGTFLIFLSYSEQMLGLLPSELLFTRLPTVRQYVVKIQRREIIYD
jgi:hypothetical protein